MPALQVVLVALAALLTLVTLLPFIPRPYSWVRIWDYPRAQIAAVALLTGIWAVVYHVRTGPPEGWLWAVPAALLSVVAYQTLRMLPYSSLWTKQSIRTDDAPEDRALRVVVSNVLMENREAAQWATVVRAEDPDVVATVETDAWWVDTLRRALPHHRYRMEVPQDDTYGLAVYSRFPLEDVEVKHLVEETVPSVFARVVLPSGERIRLVVVHPRPPRPTTQGTEFRDAELVLVAEALRNSDEPTLVAGDLNDVAWSRTTTRFQRLSGLLDPRRGRGLFPTYPVKWAPLRYPLDHVFHSTHLGLVRLSRLGAVGSDHFPMLIEVALCGDAPAEQEEPQATAEDHEAAAVAVETAEETLAEETAEERAERREEDQ